MALNMPPLPAGQSIGRNTRRTAETIQIGDSVKPAGKPTWLVVEAIADHAGDYPRRVFLLEDGSTFNALAGAFIPWKGVA